MPHISPLYADFKDLKNKIYNSKQYRIMIIKWKFRIKIYLDEYYVQRINYTFYSLVVLLQRSIILNQVKEHNRVFF